MATNAGTLKDDTFAYVEYLQNQQIAEGWANFFHDDHKGLDASLVETVLKLVGPTLDETDEVVIDAARTMLSSPAPATTPLESRLTEIRYRPLLQQIITAANDLGLAQVRPIDIATSTDISCTLMARPTEGQHLLFAGEGTARFCNFWSKAISRMFFTVKALPEGMSETDWRAAIISARPSGVLLAAAMAAKYAFEGTLLRFAWIPNIPEETEWRSALFRSMLLFSVAHEYAHFVAYETRPETNEMRSEEDYQNLELWCDRLAIALCRRIGKQSGSIHNIAGLGAIAFFRVLQVCYAAQELFVSAGKLPPCQESGHRDVSHPPLERRTEALVSELIDSAGSEDQEIVKSHTDGITAFLKLMQELAIGVIKDSLTQSQAAIGTSSPDPESTTTRPVCTTSLFEEVL